MPVLNPGGGVADHGALTGLGDDDHNDATNGYVLREPNATVSDDSVVRWDGTGGRNLISSNVFINDNGDLTIGNGGVGVDYGIVFDGENSDGQIVWNEGSAAFEFIDTVSFTTTNFLTFGTGNATINSSSPDQLDLDATTLIDFTAPNFQFTGILNVTGQADVDNIRVNGNDIISTDVNGDLTLTPNGTGDLVLDGVNWPQADGTIGQVLETNGSGQLSWEDAGGGGEWTDTGTALHPTETTDDVVIGGTAPVSSAKFTIDGDADQIQALIQANSTQTASLLLVESSAQVRYFEIEDNGQVFIENTGTTANPLTIKTNGNHLLPNGGQIIMEQDGGGDAGLSFLLTGGQEFSAGIDNSDADAFQMTDETANQTFLDFRSSLLTLGHAVGDIDLGETSQSSTFVLGPLTDEKYDLGTDAIRFNDVFARFGDFSPAGIRTAVSTDDVHDTTPTEAQIITAFGTAAAAGSGFIGIIDDNSADTNEYMVFSNGVKWMWSLFTVAV